MMCLATVATAEQYVVNEISGYDNSHTGGTGFAGTSGSGGIEE